ncbi:MAG: SDR family oxidoreductase [Acidimicrobiia bacterium]|nr:SDR family oxidoreductase [Acidimicrobiia bacterium]
MPTTRFDYTGRRVLVTGGTSGIGLGVARAFADAGADVLITGRRADRSDYDTDLSGLDYASVEMTDAAALEALAGSLGHLDVLVNNAGTNLAVEDEWQPETFEKALSLHLASAFRLAVRCKALLALSTLDGGGSVVSTTSMAAFRSVPLIPGYGAAKAGIVQLTLNLGVAWARENVRVNAVAPGLIDTNMTAVMQMEGMEELEAAELARVPMARWGTPDEVAPAYLFLASEQARFITGQTLCVDGGFSAY